MLRTVLSALAILAMPAGAHAQLPDALDEALSRAPADAPTPQRIALRMRVDGQSILVEVRPGAEGEDAAYTLLQPADEDGLSEEQAEMWAGFDEDPDDDAAPNGAPSQTYAVGGFDADGLRAAIGARADLVREEAGRLVYGFAPQSLPGQGGQEGGREALLDNLAGEIEVDAERSQVTRVSFDLIESFKPHLAARINEFSLAQRFVHEPAIDGPRFSGLTLTMAGSAVFQPFSQTLEIELVSVRYPGAGALEAGAESP